MARERVKSDAIRATAKAQELLLNRFSQELCRLHHFIQSLSYSTLYPSEVKFASHLRGWHRFSGDDHPTSPNLGTIIVSKTTHCILFRGGFLVLTRVFGRHHQGALSRLIENH